MLVVEGVVDDLAVAPAPDEAEAAQHAQMLGDPGLANARYGREVAGA